MGFNTTVVINNDAVGDIENDPSFGKKLATAIYNFNSKLIVNNEVLAGSSGRIAAMVIEQHHADGRVLVMVGGKTGWVADDFNANDMVVVKNVLDRLGYRLVKKRSKKK